MRAIRCAKLNLSVDPLPLQKEVAALPDRWSPHFQATHYEGEWNVLPLRSIGGRLDELLPFALGEKVGNYEATPLMAGCPSIASFLASLDCPLLSARLLRLRSGAVIKPHRDAELAFENGEARLHLPVFTNPELEFYMENQRVVMNPGTCWYINANLTHRVENKGTTDRIHLVVDCQVNDWLRDRFDEAEISWSEQRRSPEELRQMIEMFRMMDTPTARDLIVQLEEELANV